MNVLDSGRHKELTHFVQDRVKLQEFDSLVSVYTASLKITFFRTQQLTDTHSQVHNVARFCEVASA
jgi:hypothetical protein